MPRARLIHALVPLCALRLFAQAAPATGEAAFDQGLLDVQALMQKAKWSEARAALAQLLVVHEKKIYVQAQRDAIAFEMRTCCFYQQAKPPRVADLLTGEIASYVPATGRIKLRYSRDNAADWKGEDGGS